MANFVELTLGSGEKITMNTDHVTLIFPRTPVSSGLVSICVLDGSESRHLHVMEPYETVKALFGAFG